MFRPTETFCRSLAFIQTHDRIVHAGDIPDELLEAWIDPEADERLNEIKLARYAPSEIYRATPDDQRIPLKVFVYTYDRYCSGCYRERGPERWLAPSAERRYLQFQFILQTLRYDREHGTAIYFPHIDIFDYGDYERIVREIAEDDGHDEMS